MSEKHKPFNIERIRNAVQQLSRDSQGTKISFFESINSTNAWLLENGQCGDICLSEMQTAGRGRRDNNWVSPGSGNIYLSYCCCFDDSVKHRSLLGLVTGIAIAEALADIGLSGHGIKWPNDIFWGNKKLGGVLIQTSNQSDKFIIGIGLNLSLPNSCYNEITQAAVSLEDAMQGELFSRDDLLIQLIRQLTLQLNKFEQITFNDFKHSWNKWDILRGKHVSFQHHNSLITGKVEELDTHGRLGIANATGVLEYFSSAEIKLQKAST